MKYYNTTIIYILFISLFFEIISQQLGKNTGAYLKTPDSRNLQYRNGNSLDKGFEFNYNIPDLLKIAGFNTIRKNIENQDIDKELEILQKIKELGISDLIG